MTYPFQNAVNKTSLDLRRPRLDDQLCLYEGSAVDPGEMTEISTRMVEIAHQISIANAKKAPVVTKILAPGSDSVSALLARFFNARGLLFQVHTDRGSDIGEQFSRSLKDAASAYEHIEAKNKKDLNLTKGKYVNLSDDEGLNLTDKYMDLFNDL